MATALLKVPPDADLFRALETERAIASSFRKKIDDFLVVSQSHLSHIQQEVGKKSTKLLEETKNEAVDVEKCLANTLRQITELCEICMKLEDVIQRKGELRRRTNTELLKEREVSSGDAPIRNSRKNGRYSWGAPRARQHDQLLK